MQNRAQRLVIVRDQFILKNLSDDALRLILPAYEEAFLRLAYLLATLPPETASIERELWLRSQLTTIRAQLAPVADRIYQILPEAQARMFEESLSSAQQYLEAGGIKPQPVQTTTLTSATAGGQVVTATGNLPGFNLTSALDKGFISPSITRQQVIAAARETGFAVLSPGGSTVGLRDVLPNFTTALGKQVETKLRAGFLAGMTNDDIATQVLSVTGEFGPGRKGRAMVEALVRTSMAEASQSAHDAFYEANAKLLPGTKNGYRWWWDASNDTRVCTICAPLDGVKFKVRIRPPHAWPAHWNCRCKILPWTATLEILEEEDRATAGDILKQASQQEKRAVLGRYTDKFDKLTNTGGRYEQDPQGAVRKLLGEPLPPGSTAPRRRRRLKRPRS
jgi:hypothetical protein